MYPILVRAAVGIVLGLVAAGYMIYKSRNQENKSHQQPGHHCHIDSASSSVSSSNDEVPGGTHEDSKTLCCLCLESLALSEVFQLQCRHEIHKECAKLLFSVQSIKSCPLCRKVIPDNFLRRSGFCV